MASQGPNSGGVVSATGTGSVWSGTSNVFASDNTYASSLGVTADDTTQFLDITSFGFAIPGGAVITGVEVAVEVKSTGTVETRLVRLIVGGTAGGTNLSGSEVWPGSDAAITYGGASELWGLTPSAFDVNAGNFGVRLQATQVSAGAQASVDHVTIKVYYSVSYTLAAGAGSYALTGSAAALTKTTPLSADAGGYALTGPASALRKAGRLPVNVGNYPLTGRAASLGRGLFTAASAGGYAMTGSAATLVSVKGVVASSAGYALTGKTAALLRPSEIIVGAGAYPLRGAGLWPVAVEASSRGVSGVQGVFDTSHSGAGRTANDIAGYNLYVGEGALPDLDAAPSAFSATLPVSVAITPPVSGTKSLYAVVRRQDEYGLESRNQNAYRFLINAAGDEVRLPLSSPASLQLSEKLGGYVHALAIYPALSDEEDPPTHWKVWAGTTPPDVVVDTPAVTATMSRVLAAQLGPFSPGVVYVKAAAYRQSDMSISAVLSGSITLSATPGTPRAVLGGYEE